MPTHDRVMYYQCPDCKTAWLDTWDCEVDSECPGCGAKHVTPHGSLDLEQVRKAIGAP